MLCMASYSRQRALFPFQNPGIPLTEMSPSPDCFAVVLAGGEGSRFWPASRPDRPKQLLPLGSSRPLIQDALERAEALVGPDRVRVVASEPLVAPSARLLPGSTRTRFLIEPEARSTGPALAWAAFEIEKLSPGALMISLHADHVIHPLSELRASVDRAISAASRGALVCSGRPARPTGDGIRLRRSRRSHGGAHLEGPTIRGETRPPDRRGLPRRRRISVERGIFVWRAADLLAALRDLSPEIAEFLPLLESGGPEAFFEAVAAVSVDVAVMERSPAVEVALATFTWDDVGSWSALARTRQADEHGNVLVGSATAVDSERNVVWAEDGTVVLFDVEDLVVVRTADVTLVTRRSAAPDLKKLVGRLRTGDE